MRLECGLYWHCVSTVPALTLCQCQCTLKNIEYCCCKITYWVRQVVENYEKIEAKTINRARLLLNGKGACNVILLYWAPQYILMVQQKNLVWIGLKLAASPFSKKHRWWHGIILKLHISIIVSASLREYIILPKSLKKKYALCASYNATLILNSIYLPIFRYIYT